MTCQWRKFLKSMITCLIFTENKHEYELIRVRIQVINACYHPSPSRRGERTNCHLREENGGLSCGRYREDEGSSPGMQWKVAELEKICRRKEREGGPREMKREEENEERERERE